jgi:hypothetical protein
MVKIDSISGQASVPLAAATAYVLHMLVGVGFDRRLAATGIGWFPEQCSAVIPEEGPSCLIVP